MIVCSILEEKKVNVGLILSSGEGRRFGGNIPKQYLELNGKQVISYSIDAMKECAELDEIIVVCNNDYIDKITYKYNVICIEGGNTRNESLYNGLKYVKEKISQCSKIFITEAARPFLTSGIISEYINLLNDNDAVITAKKITDSLGSVENWVTDREKYYLIQAPEAFRFDLLYNNFDSNSKITATCQQLPEACSLYCYYNFKNNLKITYNEDLHMAEFMMKGNK